VWDQVAVSADGVPIHYEIHGSGSPALVFVHGWCCDRRCWDGQVQAFALRHTVIALDLRDTAHRVRA
jgi:pimeloyl-ACP methyl ester carboxylesterase